VLDPVIDRQQPGLSGINGMIANDKFCMCRCARLIRS
jgi:hypothetical protein